MVMSSKSYKIAKIKSNEEKTLRPMEGSTQVFSKGKASENLRSGLYSGGFEV